MPWLDRSVQITAPAGSRGNGKIVVPAGRIGRRISEGREAVAGHSSGVAMNGVWKTEPFVLNFIALTRPSPAGGDSRYPCEFGAAVRLGNMRVTPPEIFSRRSTFGAGCRPSASR